MMSNGKELLDKIALLLLPGVAEIRGEGMEQGYNAAIRDVYNLIGNGEEYTDDADTIYYVVHQLRENLGEYGMRDKFLKMINDNK